MKIKRVKRRCDVKGCKSIDCYSISQSREIGESVIICEKCLREALKSIDHIGEDATTDDKNAKKYRITKPLFYHPSLNDKSSGGEAVPTVAEEVIPDVAIEAVDVTAPLPDEDVIDLPKDILEEIDTDKVLNEIDKAVTKKPKKTTKKAGK